jgi:hypothetical protein
MLAGRAIERVAFILEENAWVVCDTERTRRGWDLPNAPNTYYDGQQASTMATSTLAQAVTALTHAQQQHFHVLHPHPHPSPHGPLRQIIDRFRNNAFDFVSPSDHKVHVAVCPTTSYINHSCVSNAVLEIHPKKPRNGIPEGQARLVATRSIAP